MMRRRVEPRGAAVNGADARAIDLARGAAPAEFRRRRRGGDGGTCQERADTMDDLTAPRATLVLGGARSGKSRTAEAIARAQAGAGGDLIYVATAEALDDEMRARIAAHRVSRGPDWRTIDVPLDLARAIAAEARPGAAVLVDCLTLWLSNLMHREQDVPAATAGLIAALSGARGPVVLVTNEVGLGIVPDNALARAFRAHAGRMNQAVAAAAGRVVLVAAGLSLTLKDTPAPLNG
jgi:adenosylcobinamide kinase/adenosylcobinamide-phosphate guanylyltransferase